MFRWLRSGNGSEPSQEEPIGAAAQAPAGSVGRIPDVGDVLAERYALTRKIGAGGAAVVYEARDLALDRVVAVKIPLLDGLSDESTLVRRLPTNLRTEAVAAMGLTHPKIARIYNYERAGTHEFLVMEYVEGRSLSHWRSRYPGRRMPLPEVIRIGRAIAATLAYAHAEGVVHNDIKPQNVLMDETGAIKVVDFGIARLAHDRPGPDEPLVGTFAYLSPERVCRQPSDHRADIYATGATLYALAHGTPPFGDQAMRAMWGHVDERLPESEHIPPDLFAVLQRAMAKAPEARFATADELDAALARVAVTVLRDVPAPMRPAQEGAVEAVVDDVTEPVPTRTVDDVPPDSEMVLVRARRIRTPSGVRPDADVPAFWLDVVPVTHADYARFVQATGALPPASWPGRDLPTDLADHPVTEVTYADAQSYATWMGKRLPTTVEWMAAYRGPDDRKFPWGDLCAAESCLCAQQGASGTEPVGRRPANQTVEGVRDLLGNVWEWTSPDTVFPAPEGGYHRVMGASWRHECHAASGEVPMTEVSPEGSYGYLGFRCARDAS